ncbi:RNA 2',3'-cyclic phosphodiesterase [Chitinimonas koreensis]|uniref:RNA 2',3'-cyclic phosphodiesterase n=1 Tax=Chitinimonas koreensis TaxID=356302 RepID=UPI000418DE83|nr:RNA 2',3'-cyclic phosphodiesterase [Chitinimonas koreensis]QNM95203.1 RNA 2',3'-cyclic phosphodiesterase [Chitinimonas koreensis]
MDGLRLFLALWPDEALRARLADASQTLHAACGGRRLKPATLHLTLCFLGDTPLERVPDICHALESIAMPDLRLRLTRFGHWAPGIGWIGPHGTPAGLAALVAEIRSRLDRAGIAYDRRPFRPHLTLLRQAGRPLQLPPAPSLDWSADGFELIESMPGPAGPDYRLRQRFPA